MEGDAVPQLHLPGERVEDAPARGDAGLHLQVLVEHHQPVEDVLGGHLVVARAGEERVDGGGLGGAADGELGGLGRSGERDAEEEGEGARQRHDGSFAVSSRHYAERRRADHSFWRPASAAGDQPSLPRLGG